MACEPQPCGHCKTVLIHDQCGKPEHMYCAVCHDGECNELTDMENDKLLEKVKDLELQNEELKAALHRDKTGLAAALAAVNDEVKGRRWISDGRGSYEYDDDRYRQETRCAFDAIEKIATDALRASGNLAHGTLRKHESKEPRKEDPPDPNGPAPELLPEDKAALDAIQCPVCHLPGLIRGTDTCRFAELHKV